MNSKSSRMILENYIKKHFEGVEREQRMFLSWVYFERLQNREVE